jgi:F0F1-type ATP synthase membrane subunit b/b'
MTGGGIEIKQKKNNNKMDQDMRGNCGERLAEEVRTKLATFEEEVRTKLATFEEDLEKNIEREPRDLGEDVRTLVHIQSQEEGWKS